MTSCDKFSHSPTLEVQIRKFQHFNAIDGSIEMLKINEFPKISINMKTFKTFYKTQAATRLNPFVPNVPFFYPLKISGFLLFSRGTERVHWE